MGNDDAYKQLVGKRSEKKRSSQDKSSGSENDAGVWDESSVKVDASQVERILYIQVSRAPCGRCLFDRLLNIGNFLPTDGILCYYAKKTHR
jgi:hypothetical protein